MSIPGGGQGPNLNYNVNLNISPVEAAARRLEQIAAQVGQNVQRSLTITGRVNVGAEQVADHLQRIQRNVAAANQSIVASTTQAHAQINTGWGNVVRAQQQAAQQSQGAWSNYYTWLVAQNARVAAQVRATPIAPAAPPAGGAGGGGLGINREDLNTVGGAALRGFGRGIGAGAGVPIGIGITGVAAAGIAAAAAVENLTRAVKDGVAGGIEYNSQLELAALTMKQLTGSSIEASAALQELRKYADITPFNTQEVIQSGQAFLRVAKGSREEMLELVKAAGALATTNPAQGLEGATYAIRELLSGDLQSIADRFNVSRKAIRGFMEEGLSGLPLVNRVLQELGVSVKTVEEQNKTFAGSLSNVQSFAQNFMQSLTSAEFESISGDIRALSEYLKENGDTWLVAAERAGKFVDVIGKAIQGVGLIGQVGGQLKTLADIVSVADKVRGETGASGPGQLSPQMAAAKQAETDLTSERTKGVAALEKTKDAITANQAKLQAVKLEAAQITAEYQRQIGPLERQLELINRPNFARQRQQAGLDIQQNQLNQARQGAEAPVEMRAQAAAAQVQLEVTERIAAIEGRRAEIAQDFVDYASRGKTQLEQQAAELEKQVRGLQRMQQASQEIRQIRMEMLREEIQGVSEARNNRLSALQEEIRLAGEARTTRIDALREETRIAQEQRQDLAQTARDLQTQYDEAYTQIERASDRAHSHQMQNFQDQIDALKKQEDIKRGPSAAEKELESLDANERKRGQARALEEAQRRVRTAKTIPDRAEAVSDLQELQHSQGVDNKRENLQQKIKSEKEAEDRRREQIEAKIAQIQETARTADRNFQNEKESREIGREQELAVRRAQEREAERAERLTQRAEQEAIRQAGVADKLAEKAEREALRVQELADKAADKAEAAAIKAAEKADVAAERAERYALQDLQRAAEEKSEAAKLQAEGREDARQAAADQRAIVQHNLELQRLDIEEGLLKAQDTAKLAQGAAAQVRLDNTKLTLAAEEGIEQANKRILSSGIEEKILALKDAEYLRLDAVNIQTGQYQLQSQILEQLATSQKVKIDELNDSIKDAQALQARIRQEELEAAKGAPGADGADKGDPTNRGQSVGEKIANALITAVQLAFKSDTVTGEAVDAWVGGSIEAPAFAALEVESPSKVFMRLADACIEGFNTQITARAPETNTSITDMFLGAKTAADNGIGPIIDGIKAKWDGLPQIFADKSAEIITNITAPFKNVTDTFLPTLQTAFSTSGVNAVIAWINGWNSNNVYSFVLKAFQDIIDNILNKLGDIFKGSGINAAMGWINGFQAQIGNAKNSIVNTVNSLTGGNQTGQPGGQGYQPTQQRSDPLPNIFGRGVGGNMFPGQMYRINEDQQFMEVFEPMRARQTGAAYAGGNFGSGGQAPNISVTVAADAVRVTTSMDDSTLRILGDKIGQDVMKQIVTTLDEAQRFSPTPSRRTLAGAE